MKTIGVIPARYDSTRLKVKVLLEIAGKPMIQHVWERCRQSLKLDELWIACDDQRIFQAAEGFGAKVVMTDPSHPSGTDRIAQAVENMDADVVINIQGDEPLIEHQIIDDLVAAMRSDVTLPMATVIKKLSDEQSLNNPNVVKVVVDCNFNALYFSRSAIPFVRNQLHTQRYQHLGIYAYRKEFLLKLTKMTKSSLEQTEALEQLRVLENGYRIKTIVTDIQTIGVDTQDDLLKVEEILKGNR